MQPFINDANADRRLLAALADDLLQQRMQQSKSDPATPLRAEHMELAASRQDPFSIEICEPSELDRALRDSNLVPETGKVVRAALRQLRSLGLTRQLSRPPQRAALDALADTFQNFREVIDYVRRRAALAHLEPKGPLTLSPLLLVGPPGCGKTTFARALSAALEVTLLPVQLGHASAPFSLSGLDPQYSTGGPGVLFKLIALGSTPDPVVLLDEIDKVSFSDRDVLGALYTLLEPSTAKAFIDEGMRMPLNMAAVRWVATANSVDRMNEALLSRFVVFTIEPPSSAQIRSLARASYQRLRTTEPWGRHFDAELRSDVLERLAGLSCRDVERTLLDALGNAALAERSFISPSDLREPDRPHRRVGFI